MVRTVLTYVDPICLLMCRKDEAWVNLGKVLPKLSRWRKLREEEAEYYGVGDSRNKIMCQSTSSFFFYSISDPYWSYADHGSGDPIFSAMLIPYPDPG